MRHVFIINPYAGKRDQTSRIYGMADHLRDEHGLECACMLTDRPGGATDMARQLEWERFWKREMWEFWFRADADCNCSPVKRMILK